MKQALRAGFVYFALVFAAGFAIGTVRTIFLVPRTGESRAVLLELPFMLAISWLACRYIITRCAVPSNTAARSAMGAMAFALLMIAEAVLSITVFGRSLWQHLQTFVATSGLLSLSAQILFALFPAVQNFRKTDNPPGAR